MRDMLELHDAGAGLLELGHLLLELVALPRRLLVLLHQVLVHPGD